MENVKWDSGFSLSDVEKARIKETVSGPNYYANLTKLGAKVEEGLIYMPDRARMGWRFASMFNHGLVYNSAMSIEDPDLRARYMYHGYRESLLMETLITMARNADLDEAYELNEHEYVVNPYYFVSFDGMGYEINPRGGREIFGDEYVPYDPMKLVVRINWGSFHEFLRKVEENLNVSFGDDTHAAILRYIEESDGI